MPAAASYPGVYIEEVASGVRTISGVATSIAAFLGRTVAGPVNDAVVINSFGDFERRFGGLAADCPLSYAVRDFYMNGGGQALIVRLYNPVDPKKPHQGAAALTVDDLALFASNPGEWGNGLTASVDFDVPAEVKARYAGPVFNLTVQLGSAVEKFLNVTLSDDARRIDRVLRLGSNWLTYDWVDASKPTLAKAAAATLPAKAKTLATAADGLAKAKAAKPPVPGDITAAQKTFDDAKSAYDDEYKLLNATGGGGTKSNALGVTDYAGSQADQTGLYALDRVDLFNLLCIPPDQRDESIAPAVYQQAMQYCAQHRAMLLVDSPFEWSEDPVTAPGKAVAGLSALGLSGDFARNAALYFPPLLEADPLLGGAIEQFAPCGAVAGIMARTDATRGVWKTPAGLDAAINGIQGLQVKLNDAENGMLNPLGINCLRAFPTNGRVVWGGRTLRGADGLGDEYKYISVRRTALFIEESLYRGTQWVVFEPNDEPLWSQIRLNVGAFMNGLFRQGAFQGKTPAEAYFVKCDKETTPQNDINLGIVNVVVGFAPLKPAEFVTITLQQIAGQIQG